MHAWGVQFHVFWACHALHAKTFTGVIGACLKKKNIVSNLLLVRQSTEYFSVQFRATFVTFSGRGVFLLRRASTNNVGGPAHALAWLFRGDSRATLFGNSADSRPTAWSGRSAIWRHNKFLGAGPVHDQDNENDVHAAKSHAKCALKDNVLTSVGTATLRSYSDDITVSNRS